MEHINLVTYSTGFCRVVSRGIAFENTLPPPLSFSFDSLYYEPMLNHTIKIIDTITYQLNEEEKQECESFARDFIDIADYTVYAYDEEYLYVGALLKSEAINKNYQYRIVEAPDNLASKWNPLKEQWDRIVVVILDDGTLHLNPEMICDRCTLFYTEEEWTNTKDKPDTIHPDDVWKYNVTTNTWYNDKDYVVYVYDESFCFVTDMMKSRAIKEKHTYTDIAPDNPVSKWTGSTWEVIVASIREDGILLLHPLGICNSCVSFFTQNEWDKHSKPPFDDIKKDIWKYDFVNDTWMDISEYAVYAYEKESGLFIDVVPKRVAIQNKYGWTLTEISSINHKYKYINDTWQQIFAIIRSDGSMTFDTTYICEQCVLFLTKEEWDAFPKPPLESKISLYDNEYTVYSWDFATETWIDKRDTTELKTRVEGILRTYFEMQRIDTWGASIKSYEKETWQEQVYEARNYLHDNTFDTPAIDVYLNTINTPIDKIDFCITILKNNRDFNIMAMKINAVQKNYLNRLTQAITNTEVDVLFTEFNKAVTDGTLV